MANQTKNINTENNNLNELKRLREESLKKDRQIEELQNSFSLLQSQLSALLQMQSQLQNVASNNEEIEIGNRMFLNTPLSAQNGNKVTLINGWGKSGENNMILAEDLKIYLNDINRKNLSLFEKDIFYFTDEKNYEKFRVKKTLDLSEKNILKIITMEDVNEMIGIVRDMTRNKTDFDVLQAFQYQVIRIMLTQDSELKNWNYDNRVALENYIGQKFTSLMVSINAYDAIILNKLRK